MNDETGGLPEHALQSASWPIVQTDAGPVALATVQDLEGRAAEWRDWVAKALAKTKSLRAQAEDHLVAAGSTLIARSSEWAVPANLQAQLQQAKTVAVRIASDDQREGALRQEESSAGFLSRIGVKHQEHELERDKTQLTMELRGLLIPIVRSAPATTIADADAERTAAAALESQAASVEAQIEPAQKWADACDQEVKRRKEAIKAMGFDSLYEAADLQTSGAQPVESPLVLKSGEQAFLSVPATLARMVTRSHYVGGSSGFSFPIGHTGIRYRVGAFRGEPVHQQALTPPADSLCPDKTSCALVKFPRQQGRTNEDPGQRWEGQQRVVDQEVRQRESACELPELAYHSVESCRDSRQVIAMRLTPPFQHDIEIVSFAFKAIRRPVVWRSSGLR